MGLVLLLIVLVLGYMLVLDTTYLRGVVVAVLQSVLSFLMVIAIAGMFAAPHLLKFFGVSRGVV